MIWTVLIIAAFILIVIGYMKVNKSETPYEFWTREDLRDHLLRQAEHYGFSEPVIALLIASCKDKSWQPHEDYNGCSIVQDTKHPCFECWFHDYNWKIGQGGYISDRLFLHMMLFTGRDKLTAYTRWFFVRVGWLFYFRWKHQKARNVNPYTKEFKNAIKDLKLSKKFN